MALSGYINKSVASGWNLRLEWTATQNQDNNTSTVTAKLYWMADSGYPINSSSSKTCSIYISGTNNAGLWDSRTASNMADLSSGQKKLIHTYTRTLTHSSNGSCSVTLDASFDANLTLDGTSYTTIDLTADSWSLNTIPRESSFSNSTLNFTAGSEPSWGITRYSSSFNHKVDIYLQNSVGGSTMPDGTKCTLLKNINIPSSGTSVSTAFTTTEKYTTFVRLNGGSSIKAWVRLGTYNGSTLIGDVKEYYATISSPTASTVGVNNFTIGSVLPIAITSKDGEFVHDISVSIGSFNRVLVTNTTSGSYSYDSSVDLNSIVSQISSTSTTGTVTFTISTYYKDGANRQIVRSATTDTAVGTVPNSQSPTFTGAVTWTDTGLVTVRGVTTPLNTIKGVGNDAIMIQNKSTLVVTLPSANLGVAKNGATMSNYSVTINGFTRTVAHSVANLTFTFTSSELNTSGTVQMVIRAYDSRKLFTEIKKDVTVIPYNAPTIVTTAKRNNGFDALSTIGVSGSIAPVRIGSTDINAVQAGGLRYQYKEKALPDTSYTTEVSFTSGTATFPAYTGVNITNLNLAQAKIWTIKFSVTDKFGSYFITKDIPVGVPLLFIDSALKSLGVNMLPRTTNTKAIEVSGGIYVASGGVETDYLHIRNDASTDVGATTTGNGIMIGYSTTQNMKIDMNEISSFNNGVVADLYIQPDGNSAVIFGNSNGNVSVETRGQFKVYQNSAERNIRMVVVGTSPSDVGYIQYGSSATDTGAKLVISRFNTATSNLVNLEIRADDIDIYGDINLRDNIMSWSNLSSTNIDHMWWDDATNTVHIVGDGTRKAQGNGSIKATVVSTSDRQLKTNIKNFEEHFNYRAIDKIMSTNVYTYNYKEDIRMSKKGRRLPKIRIGIMADEAPPEICSVDRNAIDNYAMNSVIWKGLQEVYMKVLEIEKKVNRR